MGINEYTIIYDKPSKVFYPGEVVSGRVVLQLDENKEIRAVDIQFDGYGKVQWEESESYTVHTSNGKSHSETRYVTYSSREQYLRKEYNLIGTGCKFTLVAGKYIWPFNVSLPLNIPSTFAGENGNITYKVTSKIDIPWAFDKHIESIFHVYSPFNLNEELYLKAPIMAQDNKTFCCLCCASDPLHLKAHLPHSGFAFTDNIPLTVDIDNKSDVKISPVSCCLKQEITWTAWSISQHTRYSTKKLHEVILGDVSPREAKIFCEQIPLRISPIGSLTGCSIIKIRYYLKINADPDGTHTDLDIEMPVKLGDIPLSYNELPLAYNQNIFNSLPDQFSSFEGATAPPLSEDLPPPYPGLQQSSVYTVQSSCISQQPYSCMQPLLQNDHLQSNSKY